MRKFRTTTITAAVLATGLAVSACGGSVGSTDTSTPTTPPASTTSVASTSASDTAGGSSTSNAPDSSSSQSSGSTSSSSGGDSDSGLDIPASAIPSGPVTITVSNQPPSSDQAGLAAFKQKIADFQKLYPNITVKGSEIAWDANTFAAQLAGGQLPTTVVVPFTEPQSLIANGQAADISDDLAATGLDKVLNPAVLKISQDGSGKTYGVPIAAYALGLVYNRSLFEKAGLDPDKPPTTWDEVRADAKAISEKAGVAGYAQMTQKNTGGWMFTTNVYSRGGTVENEDGTEATFNSQQGKDALQYLHDLKWTDKSMGDTVLYDNESITKDFAAGKIGMFLGSPDNYILGTVLDGMDPKIYGMGQMPGTASGGFALSGGAVQIVNPKASADEKRAGVLWVIFSNLREKLNEKAAVAAARTQIAQKLPVGLPSLSVLTADNYQTYLGWVKDQVNVPVENFKPYVDTVNTVTLQPEPKAKAQEVYAKLDAVVQAVLTDQNADVSSQLSAAAQGVTALLSR